MGDNKISEAASAEECLRAFNETLTPALRVPYTMAYRIAMGAAMEAAAAHLQGEAVPVAYIVPSARACHDGSMEDGPDSLCFADEADDYVKRVGAPLFAHPQPAELNDVSGNSGELGDAQIDARLDVLYRHMVASGQHNGGMVGAAWNRAIYRDAATGKQQVGVE